MMRIMRSLIAVVFIVAFVFGLYLSDGGVPRNSPDEEFKVFLDAKIPALMKRYAVPGACLALVRNGRIVFSGAFGYADKESGLRMTADMPMRVQSISKSVTAWAILKLAEEGKLNLDDPVETYLKDWKLPYSGYPSGGVTVRRLLCHTAGLPLGDVFALYAPDEAMPSLAESLTGTAVLFREPGKGFSYSNVGYNLLELLIEDVTGRDFSEYMKNEILSPLGMNNSDFNWNEALLADAPLGYTLDGKPVMPYRYPEKASGGLISTAEDIARFCIAGMPAFNEQDVLADEIINSLYSPRASHIGIYSLVFDAYGYGFYTERLGGGETAVSHGGQGTGWMSHFHAVPETGDAIIILTNSQRSWPFIAHILKAWRQWNGFSPLGMENIILGEYALWAVILLIFFLASYPCMAAGKGALHRLS
ncbi:MAG: putative penicillin-binding protein PbpX [Firmicutes bacterium ADurb.Bin182]|nr:MAG: putative penicillin-binding protein PbpX [Firmicutes bacterium ADurb.Bin182]